MWLGVIKLIIHLKRSLGRAKNLSNKVWKLYLVDVSSNEFNVRNFDNGEVI